MREWGFVSWISKGSLWIGLFLCVLTIIGGCYIFNHYWPQALQHEAENEINTWLIFVTGIATALLAMIAWVQLKKIVRKDEGQFFLDIDNRWASEEMIEARRIIHQIRLECTKKNNDDKHRCLESELCQQIGGEILKISESKDKIKEFGYIMNLLDFIETVGFLSKEDLITPIEIEALCGESILYYCKILNEYVSNKDGKYKNFKDLHDKLVQEE